MTSKVKCQGVKNLVGLDSNHMTQIEGNIGKL